MTIAVDIRTGKVVGQVTGMRGGMGQIVPDALASHLRLLTRTGYVLVPRSSVRLESVR